MSFSRFQVGLLFATSVLCLAPLAKGNQGQIGNHPGSELQEKPAKYEPKAGFYVSEAEYWTRFMELRHQLFPEPNQVDKVILEPVETNQLLLDLRALLEVDGYLNKPQEWREYIDGLLEMNHIYKEKCKPSYLKDLNNYVANNLKYTGTIVPYIKFLRNHLINYCKQNFVEDLRKAVEDLPLEDSRQIMLLKGKVNRAEIQSKIEPTSLQTRVPSLVRGILLFLDVQTDELSSMVRLQNKFHIKKILFTNIKSLCNSVDHKLKRFPVLYNELSQVNKMKLSPSALNWLKVAKIASDITDNSAEIFENAYRLLLDNLAEKKSQQQSVQQNKAQAGNLRTRFSIFGDR